MNYAQDFVDELNLKFPEKHFGVDRGRRFDKIVSYRNADCTSASAYAFVERNTGDLIKAGGWSQPQKDKAGLAVRYRLAEEFDRALEDADPFGGFLYKR